MSVDGADESGWSAVAAEWAELWGSFADPARRAVITETGIRARSRVLDVGCGSGEFLLMLRDLGAVPFGIDPAQGMVNIARSRLPLADIRIGGAEKLPWTDASFDVVTAFNAIQFADDTLDALAELARVTVTGGSIAIANWAEGALNDLNAIEEAVAAADEEELLPDGDLRAVGGIEDVLQDAGLSVVASGLVEVPWEAADDDALIRGVLLGEDADGLSRRGPVVREAAQRFRTPTGGYRLVNAFRYAVARTPA